MRTYLVVVDESPEAETALRFAARRAAKTAGAVRILALIPPAEFVQWGDTLETLHARIQVQEHQILPQGIRLASGQAK